MSSGRVHCIAHISNQTITTRLVPQQVFILLCKAKDNVGQFQFRRVPLCRPAGTAKRLLASHRRLLL